MQHRGTIQLVALLAAALDGVGGRGGIFSRNYMQLCERDRGFCATAAQCRAYAGFPVGRCPHSTCCRVVRSCNQVITLNNTFFVEHSLEMGQACVVDVLKMRSPGGICQMRLDMVEFLTDGPDPDGKCVFDSFEVRGQRNKVPVICGFNSGQHFYLDVGDVPSVQLRMTIGTNYTQRTWKIRVTQIPCRSGRLAPQGCLQFLDDRSGLISSFNYGNPNDSTHPVINPSSYSICFRDNCQLTLTGDGPSRMMSLPRMSTNAMQMLSRMNGDCLDPQDSAWSKQKSFLTIDNPRFCGDDSPDLHNSVHMSNRMSVVIHPRERNRSTLLCPRFRLQYTLNCGRAPVSRPLVFQYVKGRSRRMGSPRLEADRRESMEANLPDTMMENSRKLN